MLRDMAPFIIREIRFSQLDPCAQVAVHVDVDCCITVELPRPLWPASLYLPGEAPDRRVLFTFLFLLFTRTWPSMCAGGIDEDRSR